MSVPSPSDLFDFSKTTHAELFDGTTHPWEVLGKIGSYIDANLEPGTETAELAEGAHLGADVQIGAGTVVEPGATIQGPCIIGENCTVRSGAYIRSNVIVGDGAMLGNSCEFKNCLLFEKAEVPHFSYVGDSVLGYRAHLGAGVILSNVRLDRKEIQVRTESGERLGTGLRKFSALVGDRTEVGCNSVLSPGTILGSDSIVYPGTQWSGILPNRSIVKLRQQQVVVGRRG